MVVGLKSAIYLLLSLAQDCWAIFVDNWFASEILIVEPRPQITLENLTVFRGTVVGGALADVKNSDDLYFRLNPGFVLNSLEAPAWLVFDGTAEGATAVQIESQAGTPAD